MGKLHAVNGMILSRSAVIAQYIILFMVRFLCDLDYGKPLVWNPPWPTITEGLQLMDYVFKLILSEEVLYLWSYDLVVSVSIAYYVAFDVFINCSMHTLDV